MFIYNANKMEFHYAFFLNCKIVFEVEYYTLGNNQNPYFATTVFKFNQPKTDWEQGGQAQERLLPKNSKAYKFYKKWDKLHIHNLTQEEYNEIRKDITVLRDAYHSIVKFRKEGDENFRDFSFWVLKEESMKVPFGQKII